MDVHKSAIDRYPNVEKLDLQTRSERWIVEAANGKIAGQSLPEDVVQYANNLQILQTPAGGNYSVKLLYSTVSIPKYNQTAPVTVTIQPVP